MSRRKSSDRRHFTKAARAAALEARRRKQERGIPRDVAEVFVVRSKTYLRRYEWKIRRFGALVLKRCLHAFAFLEEARTADVTVLNSVDR